MPFVGAIGAGCCRQAGATLARQVVNATGNSPVLVCLGMPRIVAHITQTGGPLGAYLIQVQVRGGGAIADWRTIGTVTPGALNTPTTFDGVTSGWRWRVVVPAGATADLILNSMANS